jgi:hypothetical protein
MRSTSFGLLTAVCLAVPSWAQTPPASEIAGRVQVGKIPCELGAMVDLQIDPKAESQFILKHGKDTFQMRPVATTTGVIRLEDSKSGAVWLQISNKSMLMNQKLGRRLADECMTPEQAAAGQALKNSSAPGLLDSATPAPAAPSVAAQTQSGSAVQTRAGPLQSRGGLVQSRALASGPSSKASAPVASRPSTP